MATFPFTGDPLSQVELIYIGYFGRAGDSAGTNFWISQFLGAGSTQAALNQIAGQFSQTPEAKAQYPFLASPLTASQVQIKAFIDQVYQNLFARNADAAGQTFWLGQINTALATSNPAVIAAALGVFIENVALGATGSDQTTLAAKVTVGDYFTQHIDFASSPAALDFAHTAVFSVHSAAGIGPAEAAIDTFAANPPSVSTFLLTNGQDTFAGTGMDIFNAPLSGPFGDQPTLTDFDSLKDTGVGLLGSSLFASFDGGHTSAGLTITGIPVWTINNHAFGTVNLTTGGFHPGGGTNAITGLQQLNYNDNGGGASLLIGTALAPITGPLALPGAVLPNGSSLANAANFEINVANALGGFHHWVDVAIAAAAFTGPTAATTINVNANVVGNAGDNDLDNAYGIAAGSPTAGFVNWHLGSFGAVVGTVNDLALGADGNTSARTLVGTDDGSTTILYASHASGSTADDWSLLTSVDLSATTGNWTITGGETDFGANGGGFLSENFTALTSIIGGSGTNLFDLSAWDGVTTTLSVNGGTSGKNTVELSNDTATDGTPFALWTGVQNLWIVDTVGLGGVVDMSFFPGTVSVSFVNEDSGPNDPDPNQTSDFTFLHAPNVFTINANALDQNSHNLSVFGLNTNAANSTLAVNFQEVENSNGSFASSNYDFVNIKLTDNGDHPGQVDFYETHLTFVAISGGAEVVTITNDPFTSVEIGTEDVTLEEFGSFVGFDTITLLGGIAGISPDTGTLNIVSPNNTEIGVTNAHTINATGGGDFIMSGPGDHFGATLAGSLYPVGVHVTADGADSLLQGVLGPVVFDNSTGDNWSGATANDILTDTAGDTDFFGLGGSDVINLGHTAETAGNTIHFGEFNVDGDIEGQIISDFFGSVYQGFWGVPNFSGTPGENPNDVDPTDFVSTSASNTVVNGFNTSQDHLEFNINAWGNGTGGTDNTGALVEGDVDLIDNTPTNAFFDTVTGVGDTVPDEANVILYSNILGEITNATQLAGLLGSSLGEVTLSGNVKDGASVHMLFAYQNTADSVTIADVSFFNESGKSQTDTENMTVTASDMVTLTGVNLVDLSLHPQAIHFVAIT